MLQRCLALIMLFFALPVLGLAMLYLLLKDGRPLIFSQLRQGLGRRTFRIFKLRTMHNGKIGKAGRNLRLLGLDELPQLINIMRGEMAFIGPRPLTVEDIERLGWQGPEQDWRWSIRPGLSGLAQLSGVCSARVSLYRDRKYVEKRGLCLDFWILWMTARHALKQTSKKHKHKA